MKTAIPTKFKENEVGSIPEGWEPKAFSELTINFDNKRKPLSSMQRAKKPGVFPYYGASGIVDYIDDYAFDETLLLISEDGENLKTRKTEVAFFAHGKYWVNNHAHVIKNKPDTDLRFIKYWFDANSIAPYLSGSVQPKLSRSNLDSIEILIPQFSEQKLIAEILSSLDDKIELNRLINTNLENLADSLFKKWFVDIGDELSHGWKVGTISELALMGRESVNPTQFLDELFDHYSIPAYDEGQIPKTEAGHLIKSQKNVVPNNAVLLSKLNPATPRTWLPIVNEQRRSICSTEFLVMIPRSGVSREFLYCLFRSQNFVNTLSGLVTGTSGSHQRVRPDSLLNIQIIIPHEAIADQFSQLVAPILKLACQNKIEMASLRDLKNSILSRLMNGKIRVSTT